jgi:cell division septum initiation protein DivIVA
MDILHLVDRLEELFNESKPIWFTHSVIVDEDRMLDLIDQMRVSIPEEIKKAQQIIVQRDRILAQTQEESSRTLNIAREKADVLIDRDPVIQAAQARGEQIIQQARAEAEITRREADEYVLDTLSTVGEELERLLNQVRNGVRTLQSERQQAQGSQQPPK